MIPRLRVIRKYVGLGLRQGRWQEIRDPRYRTSIRRILSLQGKHKGQRCVIIGNGPSLKYMDLSLLKDEVTFGLNRFYLLANEIGFLPNYYVIVNKLVIEQCASEINELPSPTFLSWNARDSVDFTSNSIFLHSIPGPTFSTDLSEGVWEGATVTYVAMQVAFYLGFQQVVLVGVDHSFATKGAPHTIVVSEGDDPNHFDPRYFGKGFRWQLPDLETSELAYRIAKFKFAEAGREIIDATIGGKLEIFPKVNYKDLFKSR